jgi:para-nitrobenzyl esterase
MSNIIETKCGKIKGVDEDGYIIYKGVPYAEPPVGNLRWKPPVKKEAWEGILEANDWKNECIQPPNNNPPYGKEFYSNPEYDRPMSEDCLYLHIWTPNEPGKYPVAVWFHGGAFIVGYSSEQEFDGAEYARRGVIFVSVEYRCNIFGFLCHPWLTSESPNHTSGNYGILDQLCALEWIKENIGAFGGNPDNITIFGQSAGAMSVQTIVSSPLSKGLVSKAILQSGGSYKEGLHTDLPMQKAEEYGVILTEMLNVKSLEELRAVKAEKLLEIFPEFSEKAVGPQGALFLIPVIDGQLLTKGYYQAMDDGDLMDIPYIVGSTKDDIMCQPHAAKEESILYRGSLAFAEKVEEIGHKQAYVYYFSHDLPGDDLGAWHSCELWYMFGTLDRCWRNFTSQDKVLSKHMLDYWTNFMKYGNPNAEGLEEWQTCTKGNAFVMDFK